jgi:hypothetical protein
MGDKSQVVSHCCPVSFEALLYLIALELLATCYTSLPGLSATHVPLWRQCKDTKPTTALRACSQYRFSPAAGHHARPSSETASWPDLCMGLSLEEKLAEHVSRKRKRQNHWSEYTPYFSGIGWTDGPPPVALGAELQGTLSRASSSSSTGPDIGFFSKFICKTGTLSNYRRRYYTVFLERISSRWKRQDQLQAELEHRHDDEQRPSLHHIDSQPLKRIPSVLRLRPTKSAPPIAEEKPSVRSRYESRRHSSDPSIGSPLNYPFQLPETQYISDSPSESRSRISSISDSVRACGRSDFIVAHDHFDDTPDAPYTPRKQQNQWKISHWRHKKAAPLCSPATAEPMKSTASRQIIPANDYFGKAHVG